MGPGRKKNSPLLAIGMSYEATNNGGPADGVRIRWLCLPTEGYDPPIGSNLFAVSCTSWHLVGEGPGS